MLSESEELGKDPEAASAKGTVTGVDSGGGGRAIRKLERREERRH